MAEVVTFGETMVVFTPESVGPFRHADRFRKSFGGAESNVAMGLVRLGHSAAWVSKVSADPMGEYVLGALRGEGVDVSHVWRISDSFTGVIIKERPGFGDPNVFFYRRGAAAATMTPAEFPPEALRGARILHATGIFPALSPTCLETARFALKTAREMGLTVSFDPNMRRKLWTPDEARPALRELAGMADILLPGLDEAELMTGPGSPTELAGRLLELGPKLVVIKLGPEGALVAQPGQPPILVSGKPLSPVDSVGAGDAFAAALLAGLLEGRDPIAAAHMGCAAGALATQVPGDVEGLPLRSDLDRFLGNGSHVAR